MGSSPCGIKNWKVDERFRIFDHPQSYEIWENGIKAIQLGEILKDFDMITHSNFRFRAKNRNPLL